VIAASAVTVVVDNATDSDGDTLTYLFELDVTPSFNGAGLQTSPNVVEGTGTTEAAFSGLSEDTLYWWRARASDGFTTGDWVLSTFRTNATNAAPGAPIAIGPSSGSLIDTATPTLRVDNAHDPDEDVLTYTFEIREDDPAGDVVAGASGIVEGDGETSFTVPETDALSRGKTYFWIAFAEDGTVNGTPSAPESFTVYEEPSTESAGGCGCSLAPESSRVSHGSLIAGALAVLALVARRKASRRG
jgi:MYXO-CTERM domain-containing protein